MESNKFFIRWERKVCGKLKAVDLAGNLSDKEAARLLPEMKKIYKTGKCRITNKPLGFYVQPMEGE